MPIEDLNLSIRAYNVLRRNGLLTVGKVLEKSEEELLALRNLGRKAYDELRERLDEMGILPSSPI
jgi:DNA-directed RNA polymerase subunit alpha